MSKSKNNLTGLIDRLSQSKSGRKSGVSSLAASSTGSPDIRAATKKLSAGAVGSSRSMSFTSRSLVGIQFGKAHQSSGSSTATASDLTNLLKKTASSGLSSLLSGSGAFGGLFSIGTFGSLIGGLFGGQSSTVAPPVQAFALPQARTESFSIGTGVKASNGAYGSPQGSGIYAAAPAHGTGALSMPALSQDQIAQAVRTALLNSSSLNDVIHEI